MCLCIENTHPCVTECPDCSFWQSVIVPFLQSRVLQYICSYPSVHFLPGFSISTACSNSRFPTAAPSFFYITRSYSVKLCKKKNRSPPTLPRPLRTYLSTVITAVQPLRTFTVSFFSVLSRSLSIVYYELQHLVSIRPCRSIRLFDKICRDNRRAPSSLLY